MDPNNVLVAGERSRSVSSSTVARMGASSTSKVGKKSGSSSTSRNRAVSKLPNAKRKGRVKEMENGLERTRQKVAGLEESVQKLEMENRNLRSILSAHRESNGRRRNHHQHRVL